MTSVAPYLRRLRQEVVQRHITAENSRDLDAIIASFHRPRYEVYFDFAAGQRQLG